MSPHDLGLKAQSKLHLTKGEYISVNHTHNQAACHSQAMSIYALLISSPYYCLERSTLREGPGV